MFNNRLRKIIRDKDRINHTEPINLTVSDKIKHTFKKILLITAICFGVTGVILYVPMLFYPFPAAPEQLTTDDNSALIQSVIKNHPNDDFDKDGLTNAEETILGTNPYYIDSDRDGISDAAESNILKSDPLQYTDIRVCYELPKDTMVNTPFSQNGIVLWPDDISSKARCGISNTIYGQYRFTNFKGWARFSHGKYAYAIEDGIRVPLKYRELENAFYIPGDTVVELYDKPLDMIRRFSIFNNTFYDKPNFISDIFAKILPDTRGFFQGQEIARIDIIPDISDEYDATIREIYYQLTDDRFTENTNALRNFTEVLTLLQQDRCVLVSLYSKDRGESLGVIYHYDSSSGFLIRDIKDKNNIIALTIKENTSRYFTAPNTSEPFYIFDFEGGGYSSANGDCINFLASSTK